MLLPRSRELYSLSFILLLSVFITGTLFQNHLSEGQEDSISQLLEKGYSLNHQGKEQKAITLFDKVLAIDPSNVDALDGKGLALKNLGQ
jgi:Flp pilus assembly protein TadD